MSSILFFTWRYLVMKKRILAIMSTAMLLMTGCGGITETANESETTMLTDVASEEKGVALSSLANDCIVKNSIILKTAGKLEETSEAEEYKYIKKYQNTGLVDLVSEYGMDTDIPLYWDSSKPIEYVSTDFYASAKNVTHMLIIEGEQGGYSAEARQKLTEELQQKGYTVDVKSDEEIVAEKDKGIQLCYYITDTWDSTMPMERIELHIIDKNDFRPELLLDTEYALQQFNIKYVPKDIPFYIPEEKATTLSYSIKRIPRTEVESNSDSFTYTEEFLVNFEFENKENAMALIEAYKEKYGDSLQHIDEDGYEDYYKYVDEANNYNLAVYPIDNTAEIDDGTGLSRAAYLLQILYTYQE